MTAIPTFQLLKKLGTGAVSSVYLAQDTASMYARHPAPRAVTHHTTRKHMALKIVSDPRYTHTALREYSISRTLAHPNIVSSTDWWVPRGLDALDLMCACSFRGHDSEIILVQEYAARGDLYDQLSTMGEAELRCVLGDVVGRQTWCGVCSPCVQIDGVEYLHASGIVHRDLKPENIVLDGDGRARVCDFGMAEYHGAVSNSGSGTMRYMAPENAAASSVADVSQDVWSLGVVLFVMLTKHFPWDAPHPSDDRYAALLSGDHVRSLMWRRLSDELTDVCRAVAALLSV